MKHKRYPGIVELDPTTREVVAASISEPNAETLGSLVGIIIRCFGENLIAINIQRRHPTDT